MEHDAEVLGCLDLTSNSVDARLEDEIIGTTRRDGFILKSCGESTSAEDDLNVKGTCGWRRDGTGNRTGDDGDRGAPGLRAVAIADPPWIVPVLDPPPAFAKLNVVPFNFPVMVLSDAPFVVKNSPETAIC